MDLIVNHSLLTNRPLPRCCWWSRGDVYKNLCLLAQRPGSMSSALSEFVLHLSDSSSYDGFIEAYETYKMSTGVSSSQNYRPLKVRPEERARMDAEVIEIRRNIGTHPAVTPAVQAGTRFTYPYPISDVIKNAVYRQRRTFNKSFSKGKNNMTLQVNCWKNKQIETGVLVVVD